MSTAKNTGSLTAAAVICEYNPFHNGHKYLIDAARSVCPEAFIVAVMSGNFVQRGEPAIVDKWTRCRAALCCGADIVVELPSVYAASSAQFFAEAAVSIINRLGIVEKLVFGSESGDINALVNAAELKARPSKEFDAAFKAALGAGLAYPAAMQAAIGGNTFLSNDILAVEYIKALICSGSKTVPVAVKRTGNTMHTDSSLLDRSPDSSCGQISDDKFPGLTSAGSIRAFIADVFGSAPQNIIENFSPQNPYTALLNNVLRKYMPFQSADIFAERLTAQGGPVTLSAFEQFIFASLRNLMPDGIKKLPFVAEGLENKIYAECCKAQSLEELIGNCTGKRYTKTRITRIFTSLFTGAVPENFISPVKVPYIRVLGVRAHAKKLLSAFSFSAREHGIPFIAGNIPSDLKGADAGAACALNAEIRATNLYVLGIKNPDMRISGLELSTPVIII